MKNVDTGSQALTALSVTGAFSCGALTSNGIDDNADAVAITIDSSERVGIGTTSPATKLDINLDTDSGIKFDTISSSSGTLITSYQGSTNSNVRNLEINAQNFIVETGSPTGTSTSERMRITNEGIIQAGNLNEKLGGGTNFMSLSGQGYPPLRVRRGADTGHCVLFYGSSGTSSSVGNITTSGSATSYNTSSDHRIKENVTADWDATTRIKQLNPVRFNFIANADTTVDGFLAHEVQSVVPEAVTGTHNEVDDDGNPVYQSIDQSKLVPLLVKTIQELEARITALENA